MKTITAQAFCKKSPQYVQFCNEVQELFKDPALQNTAFTPIPEYPGGLIIRARGRNTERDVFCLQGMIHDFLFKKEYSELSKPEAEIRGGKVICQIALKPFNDDAKREEFIKKGPIGTLNYLKFLNVST